MGPRQQITEYSSKRLTAEEFAELRLFALKLEYAPAELTAGRLFTIDISLLAPVSLCHIRFPKIENHKTDF